MNKNELKEALKNKYPVGTTVELIYMNDKQAPPCGTKGKVTYIDDECQIHVTWSTGSTLALVPGEDKFTIIKK